MSELERRILSDIIEFSERKINGIIEHGLELLPDHQHAEFVMLVTLQQVATLANSLSRAYPLFAKLPRALQLATLANILIRSLPAEEKRILSLAADPQCASDMFAATREIEQELPKLQIDPQ